MTNLEKLEALSRALSVLKGMEQAMPVANLLVGICKQVAADESVVSQEAN